ncbi:MAG: hypothetical protein SGPRY_005598 [Prymnesium sp.]
MPRHATLPTQRRHPDASGQSGLRPASYLLTHEGPPSARVLGHADQLEDILADTLIIIGPHKPAAVASLWLPDQAAEVTQLDHLLEAFQ